MTASLAALDRLTTVGYVVLEDRSGPGRRATPVDRVVVGPGGVFLVDARTVPAPMVVDGRLRSGDDDITEEIYALADLGQVLEADLVRIGLSPNEVHPVVVLDAGAPFDEIVDSVRIVDVDEIAHVVLAHGQRWCGDLVAQVVARCEELFSARSDRRQVDDRATGSPAAADRLDAALVESMLASPVEEWMVRLHPRQAALVLRTFDGPARIHGAAGTGKTTVGLHRAAYTARHDPQGRVLVTSLSDVLPAVLRRRFAVLAPAAAGRVDFLTVHDVAARILDARGVGVRVDAAQAITAFNLAWNRVGRQGLLGSSDLPPTYWQEEVGVVVRGRGLSDLDAYLTLDRVGRAHPLDGAERRAVWELHRAYAEALDAAGVTDWSGLVLQAESALRDAPYGTVPGETRFASVVVDEAQDLSCSQARLLSALAGDGPDGLLLLDDGEQSIYPGGYSLEEAGIIVEDRTIELETNFRTASAAGAMGSAGGGSAASASDVEPVRWSGTEIEAPVAIVARVREVVAGIGTSYDDVGVLTPTAAGARRVVAALRAAHIPVRRLTDPHGDRGPQADAVTVGTIKRARGLEFAQVLLCGLPPEATAPGGGVAGSHREAQDRARRELVVGSARARTGLWIATTTGV